MKRYLLQFKYKSNPNDTGLLSSPSYFDCFMQALQHISVAQMIPHKHTQYAMIEHQQTKQTWCVLFF